jgi:hypothetical protein
MARKNVRKNDVEALFAELITELRAQVRGSADPETGERVPPNSSLLAVAAKVVAMTGLKPTEDGPVHCAAVDLKDALPMVDIDALTARF